ncbi:HupE/UreJ family protein [Mesorhizobium silamurunense]|uniref:HupE/UreJ family protein n=1 Tax=Mesorhizobium silamurunense TaxID=499528 RepID=UPI0017860FBA|nr:HupE/UreJ family protein [Mesorhizobium silamurunense]
MRRTVVKLGAGPACAHVGAGYADGVAEGLAHPLLGLDQLLAMPLRAWTAPAVFLAAMSGAVALAFVGVALPAMEGMLALSALALGRMIVFGAGLPGIAGIGPAGLLALLRGHAHASEAAGATFAYVGGFTLSNAALHQFGVGVGLKVASSPWLPTGLGMMVARSGAALVFRG